jgi:glyoxylase-like metal-dependent hydrolase (beta-lactamase superfamily II)
MFDGRRGRVNDPMRDGLVAQARASSQRIGQMQGRVVVPAHGRRKSALRPQARGFRTKRRLRQQYDRFRRHMQRGHQSGRTAADDNGTVVER